MERVDVHRFKNDGYLVVRNLISNDLLNKLNQEIQTVVCQQLRLLGAKSPSEDATLFYNFCELFKADRASYLAALRLCSKLCSVYEMYLNKEMSDVARRLGISLPVFQTQPVFHVMAERLRIEDGYFGVGAHQDWPALQSGLDTLTCWVPLVPVKKGSFTLEIIPKSHLLGFVPAEEEQHIHEVKPEVYSGMDFIPVEMNPGDALFFSTFLIHKSEQKGTGDSFRIAYSMRYENAANEYFIKQKYPFAQKRVVERALRDEQIPSHQEVLKIYGNSEL